MPDTDTGEVMKHWNVLSGSALPRSGVVDGASGAIRVVKVLNVVY